MATPVAVSPQRERRAFARLEPYAASALGAGALAAVLCVWWALTDTWVFTGDPAKHFLIVLQDYHQLQAHDWLAPYTTSRMPDYGPITHLVGVLGFLVHGGPSIDAALIAIDLVFVPVLAYALFRGGAVVGGRRAGLVACLFVLGAPIVISQMHQVMVDVPLTAMVALTTWLLLASGDFADRRYAVAAGVAAGAGFLVKDTTLIYLVGLVAVMLVRGGRRHPANVALAGGAFLVLAAPWFVVHFAAQQELLNGAGTIADGTTSDRSIWTLQNFAWYGWALVNFQLLLPLTLVLLAALGVLARDVVRRRPLPRYAPELLAAAVVGYVLQAVFLTQDMRYTMPCLVFAALLVAGTLRARAVLWIVAAAFAVNTIAVTFGPGSRAAISLPGADTHNVLARQFTLYSPDGYAGAAAPERSVDYVGLFTALRRDGARRFAMDPHSEDVPEFPHSLLTTLADNIGGLRPVAPRDLRRGDALLVAHIPLPREPRPCMTTPEGRGVWVVRGARGAFTCPPGFPR